MNKLIRPIALLSAGAWGYHYQTHSRTARPPGGPAQSASSVALQLPGPWGEFLQYTYTAAVLAKLREHQSAQNLYRVDEMGGDFVFARQLPELFHLKGRSAGEMGLISQDLAGAWAGAAKPVPYRGHLFADITRGANGLSLDPHVQYGRPPIRHRPVSVDRRSCWSWTMNEPPHASMKTVRSPMARPLCGLPQPTG